MCGVSYSGCFQYVCVTVPSVSVGQRLHCFVISVGCWYSEHVCVCGVCLPHACCPCGVCACPSPGPVFSASVVSVSRWCLHCVPTCGLMTSVCEQLRGSLFCAVALEFSVECVLTFTGSCLCGAAFVLWCLQGRGASCVPSEAAGVPSDTPGGLRAEWRLAVSAAASPCRLVPRWLGAGCGGQGRAGAVVGTGPTPRPRYKYLELPAAVFTRPQPGGGSSPAGPWGRGVTRPQQSHFLLARQATASLPLPAPCLGGGEVVTPHPGLPGATSEALTRTFPLGFPGSGRETNSGDEGGEPGDSRGVGKNEGEAKGSSWGGELRQKGMGKQRQREGKTRRERWRAKRRKEKGLREGR